MIRFHKKVIHSRCFHSSRAMDSISDLIQSLQNRRTPYRTRNTPNSPVAPNTQTSPTDVIASKSSGLWKDIQKSTLQDNLSSTSTKTNNKSPQQASPSHHHKIHKPYNITRDSSKYTGSVKLSPPIASPAINDAPRDPATIESVKSRFSVQSAMWEKKEYASSSIRDVLLKKSKTSQDPSSSTSSSSSSSSSSQVLKKPVNHQHHIAEDEVTGDVRSIGEKVLQGLTKVAGEEKIDDAVDDAVDDGSRKSPGEIRYMKHRSKIDMKREALASDMPSLHPNPPKFRRVVKNDVIHDHHISSLSSSKSKKKTKLNPGITSSIDEEEVDDDADYDPNNLDEDKVDDAGVIDGPIIDQKSNELSKPLTLEQLKKLTQERLQESSSSASSSKSSSSSSKYNKDHKKIKAKKVEVVKELSIIGSGIKLKDFALKLGMKQTSLIQQLKELDDVHDNDEIKSDDYMIDADTAELIALEHGYIVNREMISSDIHAIKAKMHARNHMIAPPSPRPAVVCIMGHVDHGKTTLLDSLRKSNVASSEAGGITQKLSAFSVSVREKKVIFLDTPGHAAFSSMRSSGADATDIVVLVVAMDDGVQPQTREAAAVAIQSKRTIIVALNKVDIIPAHERPAARARVLSEIAQLDIVPEDFGGDVQVVEISARTREGIDTLVESLAIQAEVMELTACASGGVEAIVLGANVEKGLGVVVDAIVKQGRLSIGDIILIGTTYGRVKNIYDDTGKAITSAGPSTPVRITGIREVPSAGQEIIGLDTEGEARAIAERRSRISELRKLNAMIMTPSSSVVISTDKLLSVAEDSHTINKQKIVNLILKADSIGTLDALSKVIHTFSARTSDVQVNIIDTGVGNINISDVERATNIMNGRMMILGFNVNILNQATKNKIKDTGITVVKDNVIYRLEDSLKAEMEKTLTRERVLTKQGMAVVQKVFTMNDKLGTVVAGLRIKSGMFKLANQDTSSSSSSSSGSSSSPKDEYRFRVYRRGQVVKDDIKGIALKKYKDSVYEVDAGAECGLTVDDYKEFEADDEVECYKVEWAIPKLHLAEPIVFQSLDADKIQHDKMSMSSR